MSTESYSAARSFCLLGLLFALFGPVGSAVAQENAIRIGEISQLLDDKELRWLELSEIAQG